MALSLDDPLSRTYAIAAALMVLKLMGQGWMTVYRMLRVGGGYASPEDLRPGLINRMPDPRQIEPNDYVERSRRLHRNDLENIPGFLMEGLLFVAAAPPLWLAQGLLYGYVVSRALHFWAYVSARSHETRSIFWTVGSLIVIYMVLHVLVVALI